MATPSKPLVESEEELTSELEAHMPKRYRIGRPKSSDVDAQRAPSDEDPIEIIDGELGTGEDRLVYFSGRGEWKRGRVFPTSTFIKQGIITFPEHPGDDVALTMCQLLPNDIFHGRQTPESPSLFTDQDDMGHFGTSGIHPRAAFQVPQARRAIAKGNSRFAEKRSWATSGAYTSFII